MSNADLIAQMREWARSSDPFVNTELARRAADALEAAEARIDDVDERLGSEARRAFELKQALEAAEAEVARLRDMRAAQFATALREAEARGLERAIHAIENHPLRYQSDMTLTRFVVAAIENHPLRYQSGMTLTRFVVAAIAEQYIAAIRAALEGQPMSPRMTREKCVSCGRFFKYEPGCSWSQCWGYDMSGYPELYDPRWQCRPCTEKHGPLDTNCANPERYSGVVRAEKERTP